MVSGILAGAKRYGEYGANFLIGTGAETMGKTIGETIKGRKAAGIGMTRAIGKGFADGFIKSHAEMKEAGGFFKNLGARFSELPKNMAAGWAEGTGILSKLGKFFKPIGKVMPAIFNILWFASSIPDIVGRTKEEGIWGGIKETGKALINMAVFSVSAAVGSTFGIAGTLGLPMVTGAITKAIFGKSWSEKKAEKEAEQMAQNQNNPFAQKPQVGQKLDMMAG